MAEQRLLDIDKIKPMDFPSYEMDGLDVVRYISTLPTVDAVVLPCKIGDEVWGIRRSNKGALAPHRGIVSHMYFAEDMKLCIVVQHICRGEWGEKVFATYEDACAAVGERKDDG
jgi:hypothetical protein